MKKLSKINEGLWMDSIKRANSDTSRKEDKDHIITYDGEKYILKRFQYRSDAFNDDKDDDDMWTSYGFKKPENGITVNKFTFGINSYDYIHNKSYYDVLVHSDFMDYDINKLVNEITENGHIDNLPNDDIKNVVIKYTKLLFDENHRSDLAKYNVFDIYYLDRDTNNDTDIMAINISSILPYTNGVKFSMSSKLHNSKGNQIIISYPNINNWSERFKTDIMNIFKKYGWDSTTQFIVDEDYDLPENTSIICFVESEVNESLWMDSIKRANSDVEKKEDDGKKITIDGTKYILSNYLLKQGDEYNEEYDEEWTFIAFDKPGGNKNIVHDGVYASEINELDNKFDIYALKQYIEYNTDTLCDELVKTSEIKDLNCNELTDIVKKYTRLLFDENHMNELAKINIEKYWGWKDFDNSYFMGIMSYTTDDPDDIDGTGFDPDDFEGEIQEIVTIIYPEIDGWYENLESELKAELKKQGWKEAEHWKFNDYEAPANITGICFVNIMK